LQTAPLLNNYRRLCWQICRQIQRQFGGSVGSSRQLRRQIGGSVIHRQLRLQDPSATSAARSISATSAARPVGNFGGTVSFVGRSVGKFGGNSVAPSGASLAASADQSATLATIRRLRWKLRRQIGRQLCRQFGCSEDGFEDGCWFGIMIVRIKSIGCNILSYSSTYHVMIMPNDFQDCKQRHYPTTSTVAKLLADAVYQKKPFMVYSPAQPATRKLIQIVLG
jgi:hypothetical protein